MSTSSIPSDSAAVRKFAARMETEIAGIIKTSHSFAASLDIGDPNLRRSLHLEACAFACHWIQAFSEATPEKLTWAKVFSRQLMLASEAHAAYSSIGFPSEAPRFFINRLDYYRGNGASWKLDERLLLSWMGIVNISALSKAGKAPIMLGNGQEAEGGIDVGPSDMAALQRTLGIDPRSKEYIDLVGRWLDVFMTDLAHVARDSSAAFMDAVVEAKHEDTSAVRTMRIYRTVCLGLGAWCIALPFLHLDQVWVYQLTSIAVTLGAGFLGIILRGFQMAAAITIAILFNPIAPIDFDKKAWKVADIVAGVFFGVSALWPSPHYRGQKKP